MLSRTRTTGRLDDQLRAEAKLHAIRNRTTLTAVLEEALRAFLRRGTVRKGRRDTHLTTYRGKELQPGVDLDSSEAVLEVVERDPDSRRR